MKALKMLGAGALLGLLLASCGGSTKLIETWVEPTYQAKPQPKVMVVGLGESQRRVTAFEDVVAGYFEARKLQVVKGMSVQAAASADEEAFKAKVRGAGVDLVSITRLIDVSEETVYHPGTTSYVPVTGYYGMGTYYHSSYVMVNDPGYIATSKVYKLETNVYDVATEKLVWSGLSTTTDPADMQDGLNSFASVVVGDLVRRKIIP